MDFNLKKHRAIQTKRYFKNPIILITNSAKIKSTDWLIIEQNLTKLRVNYYKVLNKITKNVLKSSIFKNHAPTISGITLFLTPKFKKSEFEYQKLQNKIQPTFLPVSLKINKTIYSPNQLKKIQSLNYNKNVENLYCIFLKSNKKKIIRLLSK